MDLHAEWSGDGPQVCVTAVVPFRGSIPDVAVAAVQAGTGATAGRLTAANGMQVDFSAAASTMVLPASAQSVPCDLVVQLKKKGAPDAQLLIGPALSEVRVGELRTPISVPSGFRWETGAGGLLRPAYH